MNEIRLLKLVLRDFQGGNFVFQPDGKDSYLFGQNASGKTRLVSAFTFLLFNKDALGRSDFEIKNIVQIPDGGEKILLVSVPNKNFDKTRRDDPDYDVPESIFVEKKFPTFRSEIAHGLEHTVEADLSVNGTVVNLKKVFREKWTKKRGSPEREFSGHTVEYFVNGVPLQEKLYIQHIIDIAGDESRFKLLTSPTAFPALHWQNQRKLLLEVCGDISDNDVILSSEKLIPLTAILGKHTLEDHRKIVIMRRSEINREMEKIPVRIDEVRRGFPDVTGIDRKASEDEVQGLETALNDAKLRLQGVNTGGNIADLSRHLSGLNADLRKLEEAHRSESLSTLNRLNQKISELDAKVTTSRRRIDSINGELKWKDGGLQTLEKIDLPKLREKWMAIDAEVFKDTIADTCPACGQSLPSDQVQSAREKALSSFNQSKADRLGEVDRKGQLLKDQRDKFKAEIGTLKEERSKIEADLPTLESELSEAKEDRNSEKGYSEDFSNLTHHVELLDEIEDIEAQIKAEREGKAQDIEKIKSEISTLQQKHAGALDRITMLNLKANGEKRMEELKAEEKKLSAEYEKLEGELYLMEQFIKMKVSMLTERINGKFEMVRFKLFNTLVNGGIEDCCEITLNGVPFNAGLNNAARIQAGCDIIRTLQQHFGMKAPVFCDNRESVTDLPEMGCQLISLVVSPEDKFLRVETNQMKYGVAA